VSGPPKPDEVLRRAPLFAGLDQEDAQELEGALIRAVLPRGGVVFVEDEPGDSLHVILSGKVKISRRSPDGRENLLAVLGPGDLIGELSLFDPGPRTATASMVTQGEIASLAHDALRPWLTRRPQVAERLLAVLARRLRNTNDAMADLVFTDVPGRVAKALLDLAGRFGAPVPEGVRVRHDLTQEELAQLVGASRETVNKALADFAGRGWIRLDNRAVVILDEERLAHRSR
jgi:CRP/FNR family transcriptional regulator